MKSLLVHLEGGPRCAARLAVAEHLASRLQGRILALFAAGPPLFALTGMPGDEASSAQLLHEVHAGWRREAVQVFEAAGRDVPTAWAEVGIGDSPEAGMVAQAMYADLVVLGQHDPDDAGPRVPASFVSDVLLDSGRPALVLPHAGHHGRVGRRVLVAWKPNAPSARALSAAMPLLRDAERVTVVEWGTPLPACRGAALDLELYLRLHGVQATLEREEREPADVGERLLSRAADLDADLLVMGCYGHSRAREWMLGGATRTVLRSMTLPVLLCH
jgi:nucleotide-binding universal stress UspA family protein